MSASKHEGGCHCGAVRYTVEIDPAAEGVTCNCSMCARAGTSLQFVTPAQFTLAQGEDHLTSYKFNKQAIDHLFCKTCGIKSFARGTTPKGEMIAVNVRCLDGIDPFGLPTKQVDGRSF